MRWPDTEGYSPVAKGMGNHNYCPIRSQSTRRKTKCKQSGKNRFTNHRLDLGKVGGFRVSSGHFRSTNRSQVKSEKVPWNMEENAQCSRGLANFSEGLNMHAKYVTFGASFLGVRPRNFNLLAFLTATDRPQPGRVHGQAVVLRGRH